MLGCRRCGTPFFVCRKHYRGQSYCGDTCRAGARAASARAARRRHQRSDAGRLDHRDRQRAYRTRQRARVMDHAPRTMASQQNLSPPRCAPAPPVSFHERLPSCGRCGCESAWVRRWAPRPRMRPRRGRGRVTQARARSSGAACAARGGLDGYGRGRGVGHTQCTRRRLAPASAKPWSFPSGVDQSATFFGS